QWLALIDTAAAMRQQGSDLVVIDSLASFLPAHSENSAGALLECFSLWGLGAPVGSTSSWVCCLLFRRLKSGALEIVATWTCAIASSSRRTRSKGPRLAISRVTFPAQPAWIVGAVKWTSIPVLAFVLFASTKQMSRGCRCGLMAVESILGVPTVSLVVQRT